MAANHLIDLLEEQGLLDPEVIAELRRNIAHSKTRITTEALAKLLVENGQLTRFQATRLVSQIQETTGAPDAPRSFSSPVSPPTKKPTTNNDDLDLLPDDMAPQDKNLDPNQPMEAKLIPDEQVLDVFEAEVIEEPSSNTSPSKKRKKKRSTEKSEADGETDSDLDVSNSQDASASFLKPVKIAGPTGNSWDSFRIWGVGFVLSVLMAMLAWLVFWVVSGNSAQFYEQAQEAYESRDYQVAVERFTNFAKKFPKEEKASAAKAFAAIATIRQASEQLGDPVVAVDKAILVLPTIVNEPSMEDTGIRSDLASALVSVASKLVQRADSVKTTAERKELIDKLDEHFALMQNPQYISNTSRVTNESRIKSIEEDRERIVRDVQRANDLVEAVETMKISLEKGDVDAAYQARRTVVRKYPQLAIETQLLSLLQQATSLQQQAVKSTDRKPTVADTQANEPLGRSVLLYKRNGSEVNLTQEQTLFVKAKGSIYAIRGSDGEVLWRKLVGMDNASEPIRLSSAPETDCLVVNPSQNRLSRLSSQDGTTLWEIDFGNPVLSPSIEGETIYVTTADGRTFALDASTGQAKWSKQLPQKLDVGLGGGSSKTSRFAIGDHSNLYVLSRSDGSCSEVYYLGHAEGTIAVPPVYALGQLILFQNVSAGACEIKILKASDEKGAKLEIAQATIPPLKGHVVVPPSLDGRRLVVMTDLGETIAFDVEPASTGDKLNKVANLVASDLRPRLAWPLVAGNELWIASNRFARFQIQVSKQKLVNDWIREDEDQFVSPPFKMEDYVVHARLVRGTQGVRVSATLGTTGEPAWEVDLGVPIVAIENVAAGGLAAVNSQAAFYSIDASAFTSGKPLNATENPGRNQRAMQFSNPTLLPNGNVALLNTLQGNHVALLNPNAPAGSNLQVNQLQISRGFPSTEALSVGSALVIPLDNAQLALIDPINGKAVGAPFQPTLEVGVNTQWIAPVLLSDQQTIVAATNQKILYRLGAGKQLKELSQVNTSLTLIRRLAAIGDVVCAAAHGSAQDVLEFYNGSDLEKIESSDIDGRVTWGPYAVGEQFLVYSETFGLVAHSKSGKPLWKTPLAKIGLVGPAVIQGDDILINSSNGTMFRFIAESGELRAKVRIGEPLAGAPFVYGNGLLFPGSEGVLIAVPASATFTSSTEADAL
ncbi:MAG: PQQ-binding-like beta-propeller repeat protein [Pirellulaceae bacterium]|nr:PQQ-binding-like beta-propeller repeat protein [Pirellulaceae bacterium]